jgi:hypothetical protein
MFRSEPTGLDRYANTDPSLHFNSPDVKASGWLSVYLYLYHKMDYDAAHLIRTLNDEDYKERCDRAAARAFPLEHPPLRSLRVANDRA